MDAGHGHRAAHPATGIPIWRNADATPVSDLIPAGQGIGLYYGIAASRLELRAIDVATGRTRWHLPVGVGPDARIENPAVVNGAAHLIAATARAGHFRLAAVDIGSGQKTRTFASDLVGSLRFPSRCSFDPTAICMVRTDPTSRQLVTYWLPPGATTLTPWPITGITAVGDDIQGLRNGRVVWHLPARSLPLTYATDDTYNFAGRQSATAGHYVLTVYEHTAGTAANQGAVSTVAISPANGTVAWRHRGLDSTCELRFPYPTAYPDPRFQIGCEWVEGSLFARSASAQSYNDGGSLYNLVGVDRANGRIRWRVSSAQLPTSRNPIPIAVDASTLYLVRNGTAFLLDVRTGAQHRAPAGYTYYEATELGPKVRYDSATVSVLAGQFVPKTGGHPTSAISWPVPTNVGVHTRAMVAVATTTAILGLL